MSNRSEPAQSRRSARLARRNQSEEAARRSDAMGRLLPDLAYQDHSVYTKVSGIGAKLADALDLSVISPSNERPVACKASSQSLAELHEHILKVSASAEESDSDFILDSEDEYDSDDDVVAEYTLASDSSDDYESNAAERTVAQYVLAFRGGIAGFTSRRNNAQSSLNRFGPVPENPPPMCNELSQEVERATAPCLHRHPPAKAGKTRGQQRAQKVPAPTNTADLLWSRRANLSGSMGGWSQTQQRHISAKHAIPNRPLELRDSMQSRAYIGQYSHEGNLYVGAFQADKRVRIYDTERDWALVKDIHARNLRWTITDTCLSNDQSLLLYATINPIVHMVSVNKGGVESEANVTEIHEALHLDRMADTNAERIGHFGIFSICWAPNGREVAAGTGESSVLIYDMEIGKTTARMMAHNDDVNAVCFLDDSPNLIASGSDDHLIKVWDRRTSSRNGRAAGVLVGHTQGITHIDPKGDGKYLLSNSKDQTAKIWDIRKMISSQKYRKLPDPKLPDFGWDYRWMPYPGREFDIRHPSDVSVQTLRGHFVATTLIRAYWSPSFTTGQRFVYSASADAAIYIYDIVTSKLVERLSYHRADAAKEIIRDVSWHPYEPSLVSAGFDGALVEWGYSTESMQHHLDSFPDTGYDNLEDRW